MKFIIDDHLVHYYLKAGFDPQRGHIHATDRVNEALVVSLQSGSDSWHRLLLDVSPSSVETPWRLLLTECNFIRPKLSLLGISV